MKTINYLDIFYKKAEHCLTNMFDELPKVASEKKLKPIGKNIWLVDFSSISGKSWSVEDILKDAKGRSVNLETMCRKIDWIFRNSPPNVVPFIKATAKRGYFFKGEGIAKRNKADRIKIILNQNEVTRLNLYIKENI